MSRPSLMVLGGNARVNLGIVRRLGSLGIPIIVGARNLRDTTAGSRYTSRWFTYPSWKKDKNLIQADIIERIRMWRPQVLFPVFNPDWSIIYDFYEDYARLTKIVPSPGRKLFLELSDKHRLVDYLEQYDIPAPLTFRPRSYEEALAFRDRLPYPVLLKPRREAGGIGIRYVNNPKELENALSQQEALPLIQEYIEGEDFILNMLCVHGEPLAASAYHVLRKYPVHFGSPVACRTIKGDALLQLGIKFLRRLRYHGFANFDIRVDRRDGQPKLLELNPRLSESVEISVRSGVNFPLMLYKLALGEPVTPYFTYDVGLEFRWILFGEIHHLMYTKDKARALRNLFKTCRISTNVSLVDPLPHLVEAAILVEREFSRLLAPRQSFS